MLFIYTQTNKSWQSLIYQIELLFSKFKIGNWEQCWFQVTFLNKKTPANQFQDKGGES